MLHTFASRLQGADHLEKEVEKRVERQSEKKVKINFGDLKKVSTFAVPNETGRSGRRLKR